MAARISNVAALSAAAVLMVTASSGAGFAQTAAETQGASSAQEAQAAQPQS
jgi:hypothetical protein